MMDFDDFFSGNNPQYQPNSVCDSSFNDFLSLQSPISMPSVDQPNLDMPSSYIGTPDYINNSNISSKPYDQPTYSSKNRTSEFTNDNFDPSYNFMSSPVYQPSIKSSTQKKKSLKCDIPVPQIALGSAHPPSIHDQKSQEPQLNLTLDDILNNFTLIKQQQQQNQQRSLNAQTIQQKQMFPFKMKVQPINKKRTFQPFVSIDSCEFTVDGLRSFIETHKRRSQNHC